MVIIIILSSSDGLLSCIAAAVTSAVITDGKDGRGPQRDPGTDGDKGAP